MKVFLLLVGIVGLLCDILNAQIDQYDDTILYVFFKNDCLRQESEAGRDVMEGFMEEYVSGNFSFCLKETDDRQDEFPEIGHFFIRFEIDRDNNECEGDLDIDRELYCVSSTSFEGEATITGSDLTCTDREVLDELWYLDDLSPLISGRMEYMQAIQDFDPGFDIAVMDTGIEATHPEFDGMTYQLVYDAFNGLPFHPHGTNVAGIVLGNTVGICRASNTGVTLLDIRAFNSVGSSTTSVILNGYKSIIDYLQQNPRRKVIVNMSFVSAGALAEQNYLLLLMRNSGAIIVASAGNSGIEAIFQWPAASPYTIAVGAFNRTFQRAVWTSTASSNYGGAVDIWAAGDEGYTSTIGGGYGSFAGTSMSSPIVVGVAANILFQNSHFDHDKILQRLLDGAVYDFDYVSPEGEAFVDEPRVQSTCDVFGAKKKKYGWPTPYPTRQRQWKKKDKKKDQKKHKNEDKKKKRWYSAGSDQSYKSDPQGLEPENIVQHSTYVIDLNPSNLAMFWAMVGIVLSVNIVFICWYRNKNKST